jgi:hypothetical protein
VIFLLMWIDVAIGVVVFVAFFFAGRYYGYAVDLTSPYVPKPIKEDGISRIHMGVYVMGHFAPYLAKRAYVRSQFCLFTAFLGIFLITLQTHRADAQILFGMFLVLIGCGAVQSYRKLQASIFEKAKEEL